MAKISAFRGKDSGLSRGKFWALMEIAGFRGKDFRLAFGLRAFMGFGREVSTSLGADFERS